MRLILCGQIRLVDSARGDIPVPIAAKPLALLAYLALEPGSHDREKLCGLLWSDVPDDKAHGSLRQGLRQLRTTVGSALMVNRSTVALASDFPSDVHDFLRLASQAPDQAIDVDIPRVLEHLHVRNAPQFEEWVERTRRTLGRQFRLALTAAAQRAHARHDWHRAQALAERWLSVDPCSDDAEHFLLTVLHLLGKRDEALASYRQYRVSRERDTGHAPGLALRELAERIEHVTDQKTPVRVRLADMPNGRAPVPNFDASLIGRDNAWSALEHAWSTCADGRSHVVIVEGEAGIGKSRLVDDFMRLAATRGAHVFRGRAFQAGVGMPYGPMLEVLRAAINAPGVAGTDSVWLAEVSRAVPEVRLRYPAVADAVTNTLSGGSLFHEGVAQVLLAAAEENPLAIALDDWQWFDTDSCTLIHYLVRRLEGAPILWCIALTLGTMERDSPAARVTRALRGIPGHTRLTLKALSGDEIRQLICELGRVQHPLGAQRLSARVHDVSGGNPLYAIELLKTLFARGWLAVHPESGEWLTNDIGSDEIQASEFFPPVRDAIAERVAGLPDEQHALLLTIAVAGSGCHAALLSYVHGISRLRAAHISDALTHRHLIVEEHTTYRCAHTVIASVVLESMSAARLREVHRMIALALTDAAASIQQTVDPRVVAHHAEAGGELAMAHQFALLACHGCVARSEWEDALHWLDTASANAQTPDEQHAADRATTKLFELAGWSAPPLRRNPTRKTPAILARGDLDIAVDIAIVALGAKVELSAD